MKKFIYILCLFTISVVAQKKEKNDSNQITVLTEFIIKDVRFDGVDYSKEAIKDGNRLYFYKVKGNEEVLFSNYWEKEDSQSFGPVHSMKHKYYEETEENYEIDEYKFSWSYQNTYEDKVGTCEMVLRLEHKPRGIFFDLKIYPENLEELHYRGEFKGTMDFVKYLVDKN
jgi:hypothetical protein